MWNTRLLRDLYWKEWNNMSYNDSIMEQIAKSKLIEYLIWKDGHYRWSFKIFRKLKSWREIVFFNWNCVINEGTYIGEKRYSLDRLVRALSIIFYKGFFLHLEHLTELWLIGKTDNFIWKYFCYVWLVFVFTVW